MAWNNLSRIKPFTFPQKQPHKSVNLRFQKNYFKYKTINTTTNF